MPPTPRPPKPRVQAPKKRASEPDGRDQRRMLYMLAAAGLVGLAIVVGVVLLSGGSDSGEDSAAAVQALEDAGCTVQSVKSLPSNNHSITDPTGSSDDWNTDPPTSGPHYSQTVIWGAYTDEVNIAQLVHNLEHGGIYILYGPDVPEATVEELRGFYDDHQDGTVLAPLESLGDQIALGAWTTKAPETPDDGTAYLAKCTTFDEAAFASFFDANQFRGPERFPPSSMLPGS